MRLNSQTTLNFAFFVSLYIFVVSINIETSNLVYRLIVAGPSRRTRNHPEWGVVTSHDTFQILGAPSISQEWLKLELSNFVQRETISSLPKGWQITPKRGVIMLMWPIFVCTTVDLEKISSWHAVIAGINKIENGPLFVLSSMVDASAAVN